MIVTAGQNIFLLQTFQRSNTMPEPRERDNILENMSTAYIVNKLKNAVDMLDIFTYDKNLTACRNRLEIINQCVILLNYRIDKNEVFD